MARTAITAREQHRLTHRVKEIRQRLGLPTPCPACSDSDSPTYCPDCVGTLAGYLGLSEDVVRERYGHKRRRSGHV